MIRLSEDEAWDVLDKSHTDAIPPRVPIAEAGTWCVRPTPVHQSNDSGGSGRLKIRPLRVEPVEAQEVVLDGQGVIVTYETIRQWCAKFGTVYAAGLRRRQPRPGDKWHLDEVFLTINGRRHYLWRAVDQDGNVLDILVQPRRDAKAAKRFFRKLLTKQCRVPRVLVTDKLRSYQVAHRAVMPSVEHRQSRYLNNRAENSHQPTRQRERAMKRSAPPAEPNGSWRCSA